jgi:hypothetical protein
MQRGLTDRQNSIEVFHHLTACEDEPYPQALGNFKISRNGFHDLFVPPSFSDARPSRAMAEVFGGGGDFSMAWTERLRTRILNRTVV